ncbi:major facilitator superfamily domain-containing protein [Triangularia verruculosa]|uniref:Major facilitator superfamily domain-containing protein n=1 Tax=Triangularia verruculosa TaxID=2587418 RepID=A0AAN6XAY7_9PEZI|nr:major facilitator superfamily domain-containing protein [Triangularia verruculosa]
MPSPGPSTATAVDTPVESLEITRLYLTFETAVPSPLFHRAAQDNTATTKIPSPPNLTPYADPRTWAPHRKNVLLFLSCVATFLTAYTSGSYSPPAELIQASLSPVPSSVEPVLAGITTFCVGFGLAPMMLAPLSEMNGRYPVFVCAGAVYVVFQGICGVVSSLPAILVARFLVGAGASVFSTMVGGVIADMYDKEERNTPMALFSGSVLAGTGLGPMVCAVMAERWGDLERYPNMWKWTWWHQVIMSGVLMVAFVVFFKESRGSVLLSRKAKALNKWYEELEREGYYGLCFENDEGPVKAGENATSSEDSTDDGDEEKRSSSASTCGPDRGTSIKRIRWLVKEDEERASLGKMIAISSSRPFYLLFTEPVIFFFSAWVAFAWGVLYLTFGSIPYVFQHVYGWTLEQSGYAFTAIILGAIIGTTMSIYQERLLSHPKWSDPQVIEAESARSSLSDNEPAPPAYQDSRLWTWLRTHLPSSSPESRLYFSCLTSTLLPIGLYLFGFTAKPSIHWILPAIGIVLCTLGILSIYLAVFNYFADVYHKYASSALAAQSLCRNLVGGAFPLVTRMMYRNLGEAKAGAVLGSIAMVLTAVPWVLVWKGEEIRGRSVFALSLEKRV